MLSLHTTLIQLMRNHTITCHVRTYYLFSHAYDSCVTSSTDYVVIWLYWA